MDKFSTVIAAAVLAVGLVVAAVNLPAAGLGASNSVPGVNLFADTGFDRVITPTANITLTASDSGSLYAIATGTTATLPSAAAGLNFKFMVKGAFADTNFIIDSAEGDNIEGALIVAGAVVDCDAEDQINFIADGENLGDFVELYSDGTSWLIGASGGLTTAKITCTNPS